MPLVTADVQRCAERLRSGELVAIPTETVYGLAADARQDAAVQKVFALKQRPSSNPLIVHLAHPDQVTDWAEDIPPLAYRLMDAFWPGPLTLVLRARPEVLPSVTAGQDSVALRVPAHPEARALLNAFGGALVAPSANRYMSISPTTADHVVQQFPDSDLWVLDGGPCQVGLESSIVSLLPGDQPRLLRSGMLSSETLERVLGCSLLPAGNSEVRVPGQHLRHYAPGTPASSFRQACPAALADPDSGWIWCGSAQPASGPAIDLGADPQAYAAGLYAALYQLDDLGLKHIHIELPPNENAWAAVRDRLARACQDGDRSTPARSP
jgi:L-threonylcarbamoyladenylate synthase